MLLCALQEKNGPQHGKTPPGLKAGSADYSWRTLTGDQIRVFSVAFAPFFLVVLTGRKPACVLRAKNPSKSFRKSANQSHVNTL